MVQALTFWRIRPELVTRNTHRHLCVPVVNEVAARDCRQRVAGPTSGRRRRDACRVLCYGHIHAMGGQCLIASLGGGFGPS